MVTKHEAVCLWEDHVGDSGKAPTDEELHEFALAVEERARKPFIKLQKEWERSSKGFYSDASNNIANTEYAIGLTRKASMYSRFAKLLKNRLDAKN